MSCYVLYRKAVLQRKLKGAQCSETVKSRVPGMWFVWKIWDFLVAREQKLGARGHRALLEHSTGDIMFCCFPFLTVGDILLPVFFIVRICSSTGVVISRVLTVGATLFSLVLNIQATILVAFSRVLTVWATKFFTVLTVQATMLLAFSQVLSVWATLLSMVLLFKPPLFLVLSLVLTVLATLFRTVLTVQVTMFLALSRVLTVLATLFRTVLTVQATMLLLVMWASATPFWWC